MKTIAAAALAGVALASTPALAADLFGTAAPPLSMPGADNPAVEVGSNWYLRGDIGISFDNSPTVVPSAGLIPRVLYDTGAGGTGAAYVNAPIGDASHNVAVTRGFNQSSQNATFDIGVGYRVNNYLRLEATYNFWNGPGLGLEQKTLCPDTTTAVSNMVVQPGATTPSPVPVGYLWEPVACNGYLKARQFNNMALASAYLDLGTYWGFTPYVGAGAGLNANTISGSTAFFNVYNGSPFAGNTAATGAPNQWVVQTGVDGGGNAVYTPLAKQPQVDFAAQNWNRSFSSTRYAMAAALMAGFGYQLSPSATLDIGYRFLDAGLFGSNKNTAQQFQIGFRYMAD